MPLTYLLDGAPVVVTQPLYFAFTWGIPVQDDLPSVCESFLQKTIQHWRDWVKHCSIPSQFQREVIRSALTLKLHCYEETGAVLAAITTSLPEEIGGVHNWDYRYYWLRDACFIVSAFYRLGHFAGLEGLLLFLVLQRDGWRDWANRIRCGTSCNAHWRRPIGWSCAPSILTRLISSRPATSRSDIRMSA